jgi:hypothetical protein
MHNRKEQWEKRLIISVIDKYTGDFISTQHLLKVVCALLEQKELDPDQLPARLPGNVPPTLKRSITLTAIKPPHM